MAQQTFFWHDYETFGIDPQRDFPAQFAGVRTDYDFNLIGEPVTYYCKASEDCLPQPDACIVTGITPQLTTEKGVCEAQFIKLIHQQISQANTCTLGYNNIRFDDEVTRNALYRNFYDPYEREWKNGNSRWDLIDVVRAARALRPDGIQWVDNEEGRPSFRLEELTQANGISHEAAHDALSDVYATIAMARLVKQVQPKLYQFLFENRLKHKVLDLLALGSFKPVVHISGKYPAVKNCLAVILPLCVNPTNSNGIIVYDLSTHPQALLDLSVDEIKQRLFTATADLPEGVERIPLKNVHINKCPVLAPINVLKTEDCQRLKIDLHNCLANIEIIKPHIQHITQKLAQVFMPPEIEEKINDPDLMIYSGGFFNYADKAEMAKIRHTPVNQLASLRPRFQDSRLQEMFFRYKARNYPQILQPEEKQRWQVFCSERLNAALPSYFQRIEELKAQENINHQVLAALEAYALHRT